MENLFQNVRAELWRAINELSSESFIYDRAQTPDAKNSYDLFEDMRERFSQTLNPEQQRAFSGLMNLSNSAMAADNDTGLITGFWLANELRKLLDDPIGAAYALERSCIPVHKAYESDIHALETYLKRAEDSAKTHEGADPDTIQH